MALLTEKLTKQALIDVALKHGLAGVNKHTSKNEIALLLKQHKCVVCPSYLAVFTPTGIATTSKQRMQRLQERKRTTVEIKGFRPKSLTRQLEGDIISDFAKAVQVDSFLENGYMVCGLLTPKNDLQNIQTDDVNLDILIPHGPVTHKEQHSQEDPITELPGPVTILNCNDIRSSCLKDINMGKLPSDSLANRLWIGEILQGLSWTEKMLISRVKHNICIVKVHVSGMSKMKANVVSHSLPMPKIYQVLPPAREELDDVLAFMYIGPNVPTHKDYKRTPMLVHRNKVLALEWAIPGKDN